MTVWKAASESGLSAENILFYERQGFVYAPPVKDEAKDYSSRDVDKLKRVRLMRLLGAEAQELKLLRDGRCDFAEVLKKLPGGAVGGSREVIAALLESGESYQSLNADKYLEMLTDKQEQQAILERDVGVKTAHPVRRWAARGFDNTLLSVIVYLILIWAFKINVAFFPPLLQALLSIVLLAVSMFVNAAFLSLFATTPGKAIFGIFVRQKNGAKMSFGGALSREFEVFWRGQGLGIPIYNLYCMWQSYKVCENESDLPWEDDNVTDVKYRGFWQPVLMVLIIAGLIALMFFSLYWSGVMQNSIDAAKGKFFPFPIDLY